MPISTEHHCHQNDFTNKVSKSYFQTCGRNKSPGMDGIPVELFQATETESKCINKYGKENNIPLTANIPSPQERKYLRV